MAGNVNSGGGGGGSKEVGSHDPYNHPPRLERQMGSRSLVNDAPNSSDKAVQVFKGVQFNGNTERYFKRNDPPKKLVVKRVELPNIPHVVTLSSHSFPFELVQSIKENDRSKEFQFFLNTCSEIVSKVSHQNEHLNKKEIDTILKSQKEIILRVNMQNVDQKIADLFESRKDPYQPYKQKPSIPSTPVTQSTIRLSDYETMPFIQALINYPSKEHGFQKISRGDVNDTYIKKHTSENTDHPEDYHPIFVRNYKANKDELILFSRDDDTIITLSINPKNDEILLKEHNLYKDFSFFTHQPLKNIHGTEQENQRDYALNLLRDSKFIEGRIERTSKFRQHYIYTPPKLTLEEEKDYSNQLRLGRSRIVKRANRALSREIEDRSTPSSDQKGTESKGQIEEKNS